MSITHVLSKTIGILLFSLFVVSNLQAATKQTFGGTLCESLYNVNETYGENIDY